MGSFQFCERWTYAEAVAAGEEEAAEGMPSIDGPAGVWAHATAEYALVAPGDGVEIGYRVAWDEEHTWGRDSRADGSSS